MHPRQEESFVQCEARTIDNARAAGALLVVAFLDLALAYPSQNRYLVVASS